MNERLSDLNLTALIGNEILVISKKKTLSSGASFLFNKPLNVKFTYKGKRGRGKLCEAYIEKNINSPDVLINSIIKPTFQMNGLEYNIYHSNDHPPLKGKKLRGECSTTRDMGKTKKKKKFSSSHRGGEITLCCDHFSICYTDPTFSYFGKIRIH